MTNKYLLQHLRSDKYQSKENQSFVSDYLQISVITARELC